MADLAQFGVEIPPVKGAKEAEEAFDRIAASATRADTAIKKMSGGAAGGGAATNEMTRMGTAARSVLAAMGPLGIEAQNVQNRIGLMANAFQTMRQAGSAAAIGIGIAVTALLALGAVIKTVSFAWQQFTRAIKEAAELQRAQRSLQLFVGTVKDTQTVLSQLGGVTTRLKVFDDTEIIKAAQSLIGFGVAWQNVSRYVQGFGVLAEKADVPIEAMIQAWQRLQLGMVRGAGPEAQALMRQLADSTGKSFETIRNSIRAGEISAKDWTKALSDASQRLDIVKDRSNDYDYALKALRLSWVQFLQDFGKPIIDTLTPIVKAMTTTMENGKSRATAWGETVAHAIEKVAYALEHLDAAWEKAKSFFLSREFHDPQTGLPEGWKVLTPGVPGGPPGIPKPAGIDTIPLPPYSPGLDKILQGREGIGKGGGSTFPSDRQAMNDYWGDYIQNQHEAATATERNRREMELVEKTIENMADPVAHLKELFAGMTPDQRLITAWRVYYADRERQEKELEEKMKYGMGSVTDALHLGIMKLQDEWGTWQTQVSKAVVDIGNALASNISTGLTDILDGTKSVSQGFKDMALSIIKSIEQILIKLVIQIALMQALNALSGGTGYLQIGGQAVSVAKVAGFDQGGAVGGSGRGDIVPAMLEPGEFVIPREQAQRFGYANLEKIRRMSGGGFVQQLAGGGMTHRGFGAGSLPGSNYPTAAIGPGSPSWLQPGMIVNIPGYGPVYIGDWGGGVHGIDIPVTTTGQMDKLGTWMTINGQKVWVTGFIAGNPALDPKGGGPLGFFTNKRIVPIGGSGGGPRGIKAGPMPNPFKGARGARPSRYGDPNIDRLGFGTPDDFRMNFDPWAPGAFNLGPPSGYERPGFPDFGRSPGADPSDWGGGWSYNSETGMWTRTGLETGPGGLEPGSGLPIGTFGANPFGVGSGNVPTWVGSTPFGTTSTAPTGYDARGNPVYGGQAPGFNIPGGINWAPGSMGGNLGPLSWQLALSHGIWSGKHPWNQNTWNLNAGWRNYQGRMPGTPAPGGIAGSYANYLSLWNSLRTSGATFVGGIRSSGGGEFSGAGPGGAGRPMTKSYHTGGIVDAVAAYASGGTVAAGEGVFTPQQMAALSPSGGGQQNQINISITNMGGKTSTESQASGTNPSDAREMARALTAVCESVISKQRRGGGQLYIPRSQRGG